MSEHEEVSRARKRGRSPSYPAIDVEQAIDRAWELYTKERRNWAPVEAVLEHWGYSPRSGQGAVVLAALKKFGLIEDEGTGDQRSIRLSDLGFEMAIDEEKESPQLLDLIKEAALKPSIHRELWESHPDGLPSDSTLRRMLLRDRGFTERAVGEFIPQFRRTLEFAGLIGGKSMLVSGIDRSQQGDEASMNFGPQVPPKPVTGVLPAAEGHPMYLPIAPNEYATIQAPFPLSEEKWQQMLAVLNAMKPALVASSPAQAVDRDQEEQ